MKALAVWLNQHRIGTLKQFGEWEEEFHFDPSYVRLPPDRRPVLGQLFEDRFPGPIRVGGPIGWFTHLLPQGVMLRWQCRQHGISRDDSFALLRLLGQNLPGAVRVIDDANFAPIATTEEFDRGDDRRIHLEDFAQILDRPISEIYDADYESVARVIAVVSPDSMIAFLRQMIFTVCCGNGDSHLKNFSLIYHNVRRAQLTFFVPTSNGRCTSTESLRVSIPSDTKPN